MRVLACPDKLKGSLDAAAAARAIGAGVRRRFPSAIVDECPLADGGEGTLALLMAAFAASRRSARVTGPNGDPIDACFAINERDGVAIIESADVVGLARVTGAARDPTQTTSYGLGELIRAALDAGARSIIVGLGGSATNDGGAGMAQALGVVLEGAPQPICGRDLKRITRIRFDQREPRVMHTAVMGACDVENPLFGPRGATRVFAPQKGATAEQVDALDAGLRHLAALVPDVDAEQPGAGAAGGLGFGLAAFAGGVLGSGAEIVLDAVGFDARLRQADLVITAEGKLDSQSLGGKLVQRVAARARRAGKPCAVVAGSIALSTDELRSQGIEVALPLVRDAISEREAIERANELVEAAAAEIAGSHAGRI